MENERNVSAEAVIQKLAQTGANKDINIAMLEARIEQLEKELEELKSDDNKVEVKK